MGKMAKAARSGQSSGAAKASHKYPRGTTASPQGKPLAKVARRGATLPLNPNASK